MYSPSAPTSPLPANRNSRRSSTPPARQNDRSISSDVRRGSPPPRSRTDKFANSARPQRASMSPIRRAKSPANVRSARSPLRRSRSPPLRRNKSAPQRASPLRRTRTPPLSPPPRVRKLSPRRAKSPPPSRSARSPIRNKSPGSRLLKPDRTRNRCVFSVTTDCFFRLHCALVFANFFSHFLRALSLQVSYHCAVRRCRLQSQLVDCRNY